MPDRFGVNQTAQIGLESVYGTGVAAGKLLQASEINLGIKFAGKSLRPTGQKYPTLVVPGKEFGEGDWKHGGTFDELAYWLCSSHVKVTPTADGATAKLWTIAPAQTAADAQASYTCEVGGSVRAHKWTGMLANSFKAVFTRDGAEFSGKLLSQAIVDNQSMTSTPTAIPVVPIAGSQLNFYLADTMAGLDGATALDRAFRVEYDYGDRLEPFWPVKSAYTSFAGLGEKPGVVPTAKILLAADAAGMGLLANMRAGSTKYLRVAATGADITAGKPYLCQLDLALKIDKDPDSFTDVEGGIYAIGWNATVAYDATAGYGLQWKLRNTLASL